MYMGTPFLLSIGSHTTINQRTFISNISSNIFMTFLIILTKLPSNTFIGKGTSRPISLPNRPTYGWRNNEYLGGQQRCHQIDIPFTFFVLTLSLMGFTTHFKIIFCKPVSLWDKSWDTCILHNRFYNNFINIYYKKTC